MARRAALSPQSIDLKIGPRLRNARHDRGLTIAQVAEVTGLTKGFLSQLERDETAASLSSLARICDALGIGIGYLTDKQTPELARQSERVRVDSSDRDYHFMLSPVGERRFQVRESHIAPGSTAGDELETFPADIEFLYVLRGQLALQVGDETFALAAGDGFTYPPREPHTWANTSETEPAVVLWFAMPNPY